MTARILVLPGDGIGPEVMDAGIQVLEVVANSLGLHLDLTEDLLQSAAWNVYGTFCRKETIEAARQSDALLVGAVSTSKWDQIDVEGGPTEQDGLMKLRAELGVFAGLRPARAWNALISKTPYRSEYVQNADVMVMREMCGGAFFTEMRGIETLPDGNKRAFELNEYSSYQIERFARASFEIARKRKGRVASVDKSNVVPTGELWREVVSRVGNQEYPDIELTHYFTDNAVYQFGCNPTAFDIIMGDNLFGDIISDQAGILSGSLGMLPSASLPGLPLLGKLNGPGIYEPVHGTAPDIIGQGIANPFGMVLSVAMMLEYGFGYVSAARNIETAVDTCLEAGITTPDIGGTATTRDVTAAVIRHYRDL